MAEETKETATKKESPKKKATGKKKSAPKKGGARKGATKKTMKRTKATEQRGSKTDFIKKHASLKPLDVEAEAKKVGLDIKAAYVSSVRSKAKASGANGKRGAATARPSAKGAEAEFRRAARAITLDRAQEILNEIAAAYDGG